MSAVGDFVKAVASDVLQDMLKKASGKRARRRKRAASPTERLRQIEKLLRPAKQQTKRSTSRKRTIRARSKTRRRSY
jgi:hypothetical protein